MEEITIFDIDSVVYNTILNRTACLLVGPQGVGKTSSVYRVSERINKQSNRKVNVVEFNLSDERNKEFFDSLKKKVTSRYLFGIPVFLFDEVESKGSIIKDIEEIIKLSLYPIIITSNNEEIVIKGAVKYRVKKPTKYQIKSLIERAYGISVPYDMIVDGDIRATLIRLKSLSSSYEEEDENKKIREICSGKKFYLEDVYNNEYWFKILQTLIDISKDDMKLAFNLIHLSKVHRYRGKRVCFLGQHLRW